MSISETESVAERAQRKGVEVSGPSAQYCKSSQRAAFHDHQILCIQLLLPGDPKHVLAGKIHV